MPIRDAQRKRKAKSAPEKSQRFAPSAFLKGTPEQVRALCDELATLAAERFSDLTGTTWRDAGFALARQLRELGHDLSSFDEVMSFRSGKPLGITRAVRSRCCSRSAHPTPSRFPGRPTTACIRRAASAWVARAQCPRAR
jgi:hypothetical protein